jgi:PAS domain-containing protein
MFLVVCAGWFTWFNRLARRHRAVQQQLTEKQVVDAGQRRLTALVHNSADVVMTLDGDSTATFVSDASSAVLGLPRPSWWGGGCSTWSTTRTARRSSGC